MIFQALKTIHWVIAPLLFCLSLPASSVADVGNVISDRVLGKFEVEGAVLGMSLEQALKIYPDAQIMRSGSSCYRFGQPIQAPELTAHIIRYKDEAGELMFHVGPSIHGGGISRIRFDRPVDPLEFDIDTVLENLKSRYGDHDRVLLRRKMEPAGRIIGFEWVSANGATLRIELREDFSNPEASLRLNFLARTPVQGQRDAARALSELCSSFQPGS